MAEAEATNGKPNTGPNPATGDLLVISLRLGKVGSKQDRVSSEGTAASENVKTQGMVPRGSAVITGSGALEKTGITAIIHAASGAMTMDGAEFSPTLDGVTLSVKNSLALARRFGHKRVALPFIGGKIFLDRIGVEPIELAQAIVDSAVEARGDVELRFVTFGAEDTALFNNAIQKHGALVKSGALAVTPGSITDFNVHGASAIVNAANMEVAFGGGISGVIARATQAGTAIDAEAKEAIRSHYR